MVFGRVSHGAAIRLTARNPLARVRPRRAECPLLALPAVGDNAAMQSEPPDADPPKRKRRWLQFSLRSRSHSQFLN